MQARGPCPAADYAVGVHREHKHHPARQEVRHIWTGLKQEEAGVYSAYEACAAYHYSSSSSSFSNPSPEYS